MPIDIDISHYNTGTATVAANGTSVTGQGTTWAGSVRAGDLFGTHKGDGIRILSVNSNTSLTLAYPWTGGAQSAAAYEIQRTPYDIGYQRAVEELLLHLGGGNIEAFADLTGTANTLPYFTGAGAMDVTVLTAFARSLLDDANAATARGTLNLGTMSTRDTGTNGSQHRTNQQNDGRFIQQSAGYALIQVDIRGSSGSYSVPSGTRALRITAVGGGGGGGGANRFTSSPPNSAGGGGAGGMCQSFITSPASSYSYTIGSGGAGGSGGSGTSGDAGGTTTIAGMSAGGGQGGSGAVNNTTAAVNSGGNGGNATGGDINRNGDPGEIGVKLSESNRASGNGGGSPFGPGANGIASNSPNTDSAGNSGSRGSGGSGGLASNNNSAAGGTGGNGFIMIEVYG